MCGMCNCCFVIFPNNSSGTKRFVALSPPFLPCSRLLCWFYAVRKLRITFPQPPPLWDMIAMMLLMHLADPNMSRKCPHQFIPMKCIEIFSEVFLIPLSLTYSFSALYSSDSSGPEVCVKQLNRFSIDCKMSNWFILWFPVRLQHNGGTAQFQRNDHFSLIIQLGCKATSLSCFLGFQIWFSHQTEIYSAPWNNPLSWTSVPSPNSNSFQHENYTWGFFVAILSSLQWS